MKGDRNIYPIAHKVYAIRAGGVGESAVVIWLAF